MELNRSKTIIGRNFVKMNDARKADRIVCVKSYDGYTFEDCIFKPYSASDVKFNRCTFKNCKIMHGTFIGALVIGCDIIDCDFPDGVQRAFHGITPIGYRNRLFDINKYDYKFLEDLKKEWPCPLEGEFYGYKKALIYPAEYEFSGYLPIKRKDGIPAVVKLKIPENAKRSCGLSGKCRCSEAIVMGVLSCFNKKGSIIYIPANAANWHVVSTYSMGDSSSTPFFYEIGKTVIPDGFDENPLHECSNGIHFFMSLDDAVKYGI